MGSSKCTSELMKTLWNITFISLPNWICWLGFGFYLYFFSPSLFITEPCGRWPLKGELITTGDCGFSPWEVNFYLCRHWRQLCSCVDFLFLAHCLLSLYILFLSVSHVLFLTVYKITKNPISKGMWQDSLGKCDRLSNVSQGNSLNTCYVNWEWRWEYRSCCAMAWNPCCVQQ